MGDNMNRYFFRVFIVILLAAGLASCGKKMNSDKTHLIILSPQIPSEGIMMRWSPKGKQLSLVEKNGGMETELKLGAVDVSPLLLRLEKGEDQKYFNRLMGDWNRSGSLSDDSVLITVPNESRGKFWSSFETIVHIPVKDPASGESATIAYAISFWYVENPVEPDAEKVIRFSRRGWMQGDLELDSVPAVILLAEMEMDGIYNSLDSWALATADRPKDLYESSNSRSILNHAWLGDKAYKIKSIHPSGREVKLEAYDPGITRADEERARDTYAVDREAARSGKKVEFSRDFKGILRQAQEQDKLLFVDFETSWCGPCKTMDQYVYTADLTVETFRNILAVKVDGDESRELVKKYDIKAYPTMIILSPEGKILGKRIGYQSIEDIVKFISEAEVILGRSKNGRQ
jgi:thiol-disulfide isomerase/thioredoxin